MKKETFDKLTNLLGSPIENISHAFYDDYVEHNVERRAKMGLKATVIRRQIGKCCDWCAKLAGIYDYGNLPDGVFQRHENCRCMVTYKSEKAGYLDVWSKKEYKMQREARLKASEEFSKAKSIEATLRKQKRIANEQGLYCFDAKEKWELLKKEPGEVIESDKIQINGKMHSVDGKKIVQDHKPHEKEIAQMLADTYGGTVYLLPRVNYPPNTKKADYLYDGIAFDLKTLTRNGKNTIYGAIHDKEKQAHSFIVDISKCGMSEDEAVRQITEVVFRSKHTRFVETVILVKDFKILQIYERI